MIGSLIPDTGLLSSLMALMSPAGKQASMFGTPGPWTDAYYQSANPLPSPPQMPPVPMDMPPSQGWGMLNGAKPPTNDITAREPELFQNGVPLPRSRLPIGQPLPNETLSARTTPSASAGDSGGFGASAGGFLERLKNKLLDPSDAPLLLAMGAGFAGAPSFGTGMSRAFGNAAPVAAQIQQLGLQRAMMTMTAQALIERGVKPSQAWAMAMNPNMLSAMIKPQVVAPGGSLVTPLDLMASSGAATATPGTESQAGVYQNKAGILDKNTLTTLADQYIAGDTSVLQNLGRTAAGAINVAALRKRITERMQEQKISPQQQAVKMAEFKGLQEAERTLGNRQATIGMAGSEVQQLAPLVLQASANVDRTSFPSLNSVLIASMRHTGNPAVVQFGQTINSLINAYARAINPFGQSTVSDKNHARELLSESWSKGQIEAGVQQMLKEIAAAKQAPGTTKEEIQKLYSGGGAPAPAPAPLQAPAVPSAMQPGQATTINGVTIRRIN